MATTPPRFITECRVDIPYRFKRRLFEHLFPGDGDEHAAVLGASIARTGRRVRLLVRKVIVAKDGSDYVAGDRGYRHLRGEFVHRCLVSCRAEGLAYIAVHNHGGSEEVAFSEVDRASQERGYPALLDLMQGLPVGALVFATHAAAGCIWWSTDDRAEVGEVRVVGQTIERLTPGVRKQTPRCVVDDSYDRQVLVFGERGQMLLRDIAVGVIGAGGAGSLIIEYLARLGVGHLVVADPDRVEPSNLSRIVGASRWDARWPFRKAKVQVAKRVARRANPSIQFSAIFGSIVQQSVARRFCECDFIFLAADTASARLVFNAIVQQYYVPGIQVGAKVWVDAKSGAFLDVFSVMRWALPGNGCLWCSGLISPHRLALEAKSSIEREEQRYGTESPNPSVITLNAVSASHAVNEFLFAVQELRTDPDETIGGYMWHHLSQRMAINGWNASDNCSECGTEIGSRLGRGDLMELPTTI